MKCRRCDHDDVRLWLYCPQCGAPFGGARFGTLLIVVLLSGVAVIAAALLLLSFF